MFQTAMIEQALRQVHVPVFHFYAFHKADRYVVWAEDGEGEELAADNQKVGQVLSGTILRSDGEKHTWKKVSSVMNSEADAEAAIKQFLSIAGEP